MSIEQVGNAVDIAIHKLTYMESLYGQVKEQVDKMQYKIQLSEKELNTLNDEIASDKVLLNSYDTLRERKREESEQLNKDISRLKLLFVDLRTMMKNILKSKRLLKGQQSELSYDTTTITKGLTMRE